MSTARLSPREAETALQLIAARFTALEIGREINKDASTIYHWASESRPRVKLHGHEATPTRKWLGRGHALVRFEYVAFGTIWRDPGHNSPLNYCAPYVDKLLELGKLELYPNTAVYRLKDTQWAKASSNVVRLSSPRRSSRTAIT